MKKVMISYIAILEFDPDGVCISFPDIPSALSCAEDEVEATLYAKECLDLSLHGMKKADLPNFSPFSEILVHKNQKAVLVTVEIMEKHGYLFGSDVLDADEETLSVFFDTDEKIIRNLAFPEIRRIYDKHDISDCKRYLIFVDMRGRIHIYDNEEMEELDIIQDISFPEVLERVNLNKDVSAPFNSKT